MDEGAQNVMLLLLYVAVGFGLLGGWPHWSGGVKALYCVLFPLHALAAELFKSVWPAIRPKTDNARAIWIIAIIALILVALGVL